MARRRTLMGSALLAAAILLGALFLSIAAATLGPEDTVACGRGHMLNRMAQAITRALGAGEIEGPSANYCVVPSTAAWLLAAAVFPSILALVFLVSRRRSRAPIRSN